MTKFQRSMAILTTVVMEAVEKLDFLSREDDPVMPAEYYPWADPKLWRASCVRPQDRRM